MKVRYYKLHQVLKEKKLSLEGLRRALGLFPTEIARIETNRLIDWPTLLRICAFLDVDIADVIECDPGEDELFYNAKILKSHSYVPKRYIKKEFVKDTDA